MARFQSHLSKPTPGTIDLRMMKIPITVGRAGEDASKTTTTVDFPPAFLSLDNDAQVVAIGSMADRLASLAGSASRKVLEQLREPVQVELLLGLHQDNSVDSVELVWPEPFNLEQRRAVGLAIGVGLHQCAVELARRGIVTPDGAAQ